MTYKIPGKLYLIGEYNVLKSGQSAIVMAVNRFIYLKIKKAPDFKYQINKTLYDAKQLSESSLTLTNKIVRMVHQYIERKKIKLSPYHIEIKNELEDHNHLKYGLGSSAALLVGLTKAITERHFIHLEPLELFKLCVYIQHQIGHVSSGGDLAASIFKGIIHYQSYDQEWIQEHLEDEDIIEKKWPLLSIDQMDVTIHLAVGWTQNPYDSSAVEVFRNIKDLDAFHKRANEQVLLFKQAILNGLQEKMGLLFESYQKEFEFLSIEHHMDLISKEHIHLIQAAHYLGFKAKISGAGRGDCGIAIGPDRRIHKLYQLWKTYAIKPLYIKVYK